MLNYLDIWLIFLIWLCWLWNDLGKKEFLRVQYIDIKIFKFEFFWMFVYFVDIKKKKVIYFEKGSGSCGQN